MEGNGGDGLQAKFVQGTPLPQCAISVAATWVQILRLIRGLSYIVVKMQLCRVITYIYTHVFDSCQLKFLSGLCTNLCIL